VFVVVVMIMLAVVVVVVCGWRRGVWLMEA
jgi:hypothetical protein